MKKLLVALSSFLFVTTVVSTSVACNNKESDNKESDVISTNNANEQLSNLDILIFTDQELGAKNKAEKLNELLLANDQIKTIIKGDVTLENNKFTLKVGEAKADDINLVENAIVTVSGEVHIKKENSNKKFEFKVKIENSNKKLANEAVRKLSELKDIKIMISDLGAKNKAEKLNELLLANDQIKAIIKGDVTLENNKFGLGNLMEDNEPTDANLSYERDYDISGNVIVNKIKADTYFSFKIKLEFEKDVKAANEKVKKFWGLTPEIAAVDLGEKNKKEKLEKLLVSHPMVVEILTDDFEISISKFEVYKSLVIGDGLEADDDTLTENVIVATTGKVKFNGKFSYREFYIKIKLI